MDAYDKAIKMMLESMGCTHDAEAKPKLARAYYVKWATLVHNGGNKATSTQYYNRAFILDSNFVGVFYHAAQSKQTSIIIPALIKKGLNINTRDENGNTPLVLSIINKDGSAAKTLMQYGANPDVILNEKNWTPLMMAAYYGNKEAIAAMLDVGADLHIKNNEGMTAKRIAEKQGFADIVKLMNIEQKI